MKKKYLLYAALPVATLVVASAVSASANGLSFGFGQQASPEEIAQRQQERFQQEAQLLGINIDDVKDGWAQGQTLWQIAEQNGITQEQLQAKMQEMHQQQMQERLQALIDQGVISQQQADSRLQFMQQHQQEKSMGECGFGRGMRGMMPF